MRKKAKWKRVWVELYDDGVVRFKQSPAESNTDMALEQPWVRLRHDHAVDLPPGLSKHGWTIKLSLAMSAAELRDKQLAKKRLKAAGKGSGLMAAAMKSGAALKRSALESGGAAKVAAALADRKERQLLAKRAKQRARDQAEARAASLSGGGGGGGGGDDNEEVRALVVLLQETHAGWRGRDAKRQRQGRAGRAPICAPALGARQHGSRWIGHPVAMAPAQALDGGHARPSGRVMVSADAGPH